MTPTGRLLVIRGLGMRVNPVVFATSATLILTFLALGSLLQDATRAVFERTESFIVAELGWLYVVAVTGFLVFLLWLLVSPYGAVRLGRDDERPEFSTLTWFTMLFSAGMGIGLVFYAVAEPILHYIEPPRAVPRSLDAAEKAMEITFFHWGLHAWAIYCVMGVALAYAAFRRGLPLTLRSVFYPLLGDRTWGLAGDAIDTLAIFGTLFGLATSLGLGAMQVNEGLARLGLMSVSESNQLWLIAGITILATISVVSGLSVGIRRLSELNFVLGLTLLGFVLVMGPTSFILKGLVEQLGGYLQSLIDRSLRTDVFRSWDWQAKWTLFYWGWWIAWAPFVGTFVARVSRGRTIREMVLGVLIAPTLFGFLWLGVFGNAALHAEIHGFGIAKAVQTSVPSALYALLDTLPAARPCALLAAVVVICFFVTSSDSGSMVVDILSANGDPNPPVGQRIFWSFAEGASAAVLLVAGGLRVLQTAVITTALPLVLLMIAMCVSLVVGLRREHPLNAERAP